MPVPENPVSSWDDYYRSAVAKPLHPLYAELDPHLPPGGRAIELGCGVGHGVLHLLELGFDVLAVDGLSQAIDHLLPRVPAAHRTRLTTRVCSFEDLDLGSAAFDVAVAGFSLFFLPRTEFDRFWPNLVASLKPGGLFSGQFLGPNDDWADRHTTHSEAEVRAMLAPFDVLYWEEADRDGETTNGTPKRWHVFHIVARLR